MFDILMTLLAGICDDPYDPRVQCPDRPLPVERRWLEHHGLSAPPERLHGDEAFADWVLDCCAPAAAADRSIHPVWTGWPDQVQVKGQALIARTDAGRHQSALRGCHMARI